MTKYSALDWPDRGIYVVLYHLLFLFFIVSVATGSVHELHSFFTFCSLLIFD